MRWIKVNKVDRLTDKHRTRPRFFYIDWKLLEKGCHRFNDLTGTHLRALLLGEYLGESIVEGEEPPYQWLSDDDESDSEYDEYRCPVCRDEFEDIPLHRCVRFS